MNKRIKDLWVKALRSNEFRQGKKYLEKNNRYCALGVLSVLALMEGQCTYFKKTDIGQFDGKKRTLSYNVRAWAGLSLDDGVVEVNYQGRKTSIADLNDMGLSFHELANILDKEYQ